LIGKKLYLSKSRPNDLQIKYISPATFYQFDSYRNDFTPTKGEAQWVYDLFEFGLSFLFDEFDPNRLLYFADILNAPVDSMIHPIFTLI
jgi:hypothetical protein